MKHEHIKLDQLNTNSANPRFIRDAKFAKLVNSILVLPKMLSLRPIVVDDTMTVLGGNMRLRALQSIAGLTEDELRERLQSIEALSRKTDTEQEQLLNYWLRWHDSPTAEIVRADQLTDEEQREFIIKDNVGFGEWDMDMLANEWDAQDLGEWGVDFGFQGSGDLSLDNFFEEKEEESKEAKLQIIISLPEGQKEQKDKINEVLTESLQAFNGIQIK